MLLLLRVCAVRNNAQAIRSPALTPRLLQTSNELTRTGPVKHDNARCRCARCARSMLLRACVIWYVVHAHTHTHIHI